MSKFSTLILITGVVMVASAFKYASKAAKVSWQPTDVVTSQWNENKKPILIDIFTDWCHYCKVMEKTTYSNDSVAGYLNDHFYMAKVNAESKTPFNWMGKVYEYIPKYKVNQLAIDLTRGNMVYPSTIIIPVTGEPQVIGGALSVQEMEQILKYFANGHYGKTDWNDFIKNFKSTW